MEDLGSQRSPTSAKFPVGGVGDVILALPARATRMLSPMQDEAARSDSAGMMARFVFYQSIQQPAGAAVRLSPVGHVGLYC